MCRKIYLMTYDMFRNQQRGHHFRDDSELEMCQYSNPKAYQYMMCLYFLCDNSEWEMCQYLNPNMYPDLMCRDIYLMFHEMMMNEQ